jgi:hypothetical protein
MGKQWENNGKTMGQNMTQTWILFSSRTIFKTMYVRVKHGDDYTIVGKQSLFAHCFPMFDPFRLILWLTHNRRMSDKCLTHFRHGKTWEFDTCLSLVFPLFLHVV